MMRAFCKSRLFWLGVPGLVFLLWVWWDSGRFSSQLIWHRTTSTHCVEIREGKVGWSRETPGTLLAYAKPYRVIRFDHATWLAEPRERHFDFVRPFDWDEYSVAEVPDPVLESDESLKGNRIEFTEGSIALWVVVLGYVALWLGGVVWGQRKGRVLRFEDLRFQSGVIANMRLHGGGLGK